MGFEGHGGRTYSRPVCGVRLIVLHAACQGVREHTPEWCVVDPEAAAGERAGARVGRGTP